MMNRLIVFATTACSLLFGVGLGVVIAQDIKKGLPFSSARTAGETIYLSGEIPLKPDGTFETGDAASQTQQVMENLSRTLQQKGCSFDDVVKATVYLKDMEDYQAMNDVYRTYFSGQFPARECVGGLQIAFDSRLEISVIAYKQK